MLNQPGLSDMIQSNAAKVIVIPKPIAIGPDHFCMVEVSWTSPDSSWARLRRRNHRAANAQKST